MRNTGIIITLRSSLKLPFLFRWQLRMSCEYSSIRVDVA